MKILALDLGTKTGFAHNLTGEDTAGMWLLATSTEVKEWGKNRMRLRCDPRILRLAGKISSFRDPRPDIVIFEHLNFATTTYQTQLWGSFRGAVWLTCASMGVIVECVPSNVLKKFATKHGGATKEMMHAACMGRPVTFSTMDDNAVDAYWLLQWAEKYLSRMKLE